MTENEYGAQIVKITDDHKLQLDENELTRILMREDVRDLPVMVVSIVGPSREGKSFLLNYFLRYLNSPDSNRADGTWLGETDAPLTGFEWKGGSRVVTKGITMWLKPFVTTMPSGEKVVVLLLDTRGRYSGTSTVRDDSSIFMLSTLLSSLQIYYLMHNIKEDDLLYLQLLVQYGRLFEDQSNKAFQVLEFLVRDWQFNEDWDYGATGGDSFLQTDVWDNDRFAKETKDLITHLRSSFDKISCFLMPHPGINVLKRKFKGAINDLDPVFRSNLIQLVSTLFRPENLQPKLIKGQRLKARDLLEFLKGYITLFNSDTIPTPINIKKVTEDLHNIFIMKLRHFTDSINQDWGADKPSWVPANDFSVLHSRYKYLTLNDFRKKQNSDPVQYLKLHQRIDEEQEKFRAINEAKQLKAIESAQAAYNAEISKATENSQSSSLQQVLEINSRAFGAAFQVYNANRKRVTTNPDDDIFNFIRDLEKKYTIDATV